MKRGREALLAVIVIMALVFSLPTLAPVTRAAEPLRVGIIYYDFGLSVVDFQRTAMQALAKKLGVELIELSSDWDTQKELNAVENLISKECSVIILQPVSQNSAGHLIEMGHKAGIPVVSFDGLAKNTPTDAYVTAYSEKVGELQAQFVLDKLGAEKPLKVAILEGEAGDDIAEKITFGNYTVFKQHPNVEVVVDQKHPAWDKDKAMATAENTLSKYGENLSAFIANNDMMAMGALQAVKAAGLLGKVMVVGADADEDALKSVMAGELAATMDKDPIDMAESVLNVAVAVAQKQPFKESFVMDNGSYKCPVVQTRVELITKDNMSVVRYRYPRSVLFNGQDTKKIGVVFYEFGLTVVDFQRKAMDALAPALGVEVTQLSSDWDTQKELNVVENLIAKKVDVIVVQPVSQNAAGLVVDMGQKAGIPVISFDGLAKKTPTDAYVTAYSELVGEKQAQFVMEQLGDKPIKVAILEGEAGDDIAERITWGNLNEFKKHPNVEVVVDLKHPGWDKDKAMATAENALSKYGEALNAIVANNDMMAMGALQAVKAAGLLGKVVVVGADADEDALKSVWAGELGATVDKDPVEMGDVVLRVANAIARKQPIIDGHFVTAAKTQMMDNGGFQVPMVTTRISLITKDNLAEMKYRYPNSDLWAQIGQ